MRPVHYRIIKTIAFAPTWVAFILSGLGYLFPGTWGGTIWGEFIMAMIAFLTAAVIYWGLLVLDSKKGPDS